MAYRWQPQAPTIDTPAAMGKIILELSFQGRTIHANCVMKDFAG